MASGLMYYCKDLHVLDGEMTKCSMPCSAFGMYEPMMSGMNDFFGLINE
jgi:hypothetical protein